jgi:hypothetical protein
MVPVRVSNDRAVNRLPGIYVEISRLTVEAARSEGEEGHDGK